LEKFIGELQELTTIKERAKTNSFLMKALLDCVILLKANCLALEETKGLKPNTLFTGKLTCSA